MLLGVLVLYAIVGENCITRVVLFFTLIGLITSLYFIFLQIIALGVPSPTLFWCSTSTYLGFIYFIRNWFIMQKAIVEIEIPNCSRYFSFETRATVLMLPRN
jgi:hypothetical protein